MLARTESRKTLIATRAAREQAELHGSHERQLRDAELQGRISGSEDWRRARGEIGSDATSSASSCSGAQIQGPDLSDISVVCRWDSHSTGMSGVQAVGSATITPAQSLCLTPARNDCVGAAWLDTKQVLHDIEQAGFMCEFSFRIASSGADGFAFVLVCLLEVLSSTHACVSYTGEVHGSKTKPTPPLEKVAPVWGMLESHTVSPLNSTPIRRLIHRTTRMATISGLWHRTSDSNATYDKCLLTGLRAASILVEQTATLPTTNTRLHKPLSYRPSTMARCTVAK
jgi:hypothetical protein